MTGATRRINHGRGHSYQIDGQRVESVTWVKSNGIPAPGLIKWAAETTAGYAVDNWDTLAETTPSKRLAALQKARFETSSAAAARGTEIHELAMRLAGGEEVDVPDPAAGHVDAYLQFVADWKPEELLVETPVYNRTLAYAGTLDLVAGLADGLTWLLDWKTSGGGIWPDTAIQLAAYQHAEFYIDHDGNETPLPHIDRAGAVWLRADGYDLHPLNTDETVFRLWRYAREIARYGEHPREQYVADAIQPPPQLAA